MTNQYKAVSEYGKAVFGEDIFDADFTAAEEKDHFDGGHLELVPRNYKITSNNFSGGPEGTHYRAALLKEIEEALISGGHIVRDDPPPAKAEEAPAADVPAPAKKATSKKE